ncbi:MAG: prepilin-type N-terminal cleavage/methylation domain-containing protein [bacterium]
MQKINQGFTLIELLIVVAIIAILAAIAIPNFLAAQVRAKASRVKNDVSTVATAVEAYYVDYNEYPASPVITQQFQGDRNSAYSFIPETITTPIAYISNNKIIDVFALGMYDDQHNRLFWQNTTWLNKNYGTGGWEDLAFWLNAYGYWKLGSLGPNADYDGGFNYYDPTNGVVSNGDIYRTQKHPDGKFE